MSMRKKIAFLNHTHQITQSNAHAHKVIPYSKPRLPYFGGRGIRKEERRKKKRREKDSERREKEVEEEREGLRVGRRRAKRQSSC